MEARQEVRQRILRARDGLTAEQRQGFSREITETLVQTTYYKSASFFYCYMDFRSEVMTTDLIRRALADGKVVSVPRVEESGSSDRKSMSFYSITSADEVSQGYMGIREPSGQRAEGTPGLVIVPGAVFDPECNRLGYGGGFYDRYFAENPCHLKIALAYELQIIPDLRVKSHDVPMDGIITEKRIYEKVRF